MTHFHEPIRFVPGALGPVVEIRTTGEAAVALDSAWPDTRGKWYFAARRACRAAQEGKTSVHIARRILIYAAEESRLPLAR